MSRSDSDLLQVDSAIAEPGRRHASSLLMANNTDTPSPALSSRTSPSPAESSESSLPPVLSSPSPVRPDAELLGQSSETPTAVSTPGTSAAPLNAPIKNSNIDVCAVQRQSFT